MKKYLIIGLGNFGKEYAYTRHNIGFDICDDLVIKHGVKSYELEKLAMRTEIKIKGRPVVVIKPTTYMNNSGKAVRYYLTKEKVEIENMLVIVDDLFLDLAQIRFRNKGTDGGHNGLKDIQEKLSTQKYPRMKIGIGDNFPKGKQSDYVLGKWTAAEMQTLSKKKDTFVDAVETFVFRGLSTAMNTFN